MEAEKIMETLAEEIEKTLKEMAAAKSLEEKLALSKVLKNLSSSLNVFFDMASELMEMEEEE